MWISFPFSIKFPLVEYTEEYWDRIFTLFSKAAGERGKALPSVSQIAAGHRQDPFAVLVGTLISLRTKDEVTLASSERLLSKAPDPLTLSHLETGEIEKAIYPAGFYKRKAVQLKEIASILVTRFKGRVPETQEELLSLPGVGIKTANLTLNLGFGIDAICVDCHVHQIANRLGWIETRSPEESVEALEAIMPRRFWIPLNELLVAYGQTVCLSISPLCSQCPVWEECPKHGVGKHR